jgi:hypothetical protein
MAIIIYRGFRGLLLVRFHGGCVDASHEFDTSRAYRQVTAKKKRLNKMTGN